MKRIIFYIIIFMSINLYSQDITENVITEYEDTLSDLANTIMNGENEQIRKKANSGFISELKEVLKYKQSYSYPFNKLITISILSPEDKSFKMFNWIFKKDNGEYHYFAIIMMPSKKYEQWNTLIELQDKSDEINNPEEVILNQDNWYGCLYYKIISTKKRNNQYYTTLAWDGNNNKTTKKIIDVIQIRDDNVIFGKQIFNKNDTIRNRIMIEYNATTSISVKYDDKKRRIVFDHLTRLDQDSQVIGQLYVPDGRYDSYEYRNNQWQYKEDIDARIEKMNSKKTKTTNEKGLFGK